MNLSEINWELDSVGVWPLPVKAAIIAILCLVAMGLGY